MRFVKDHPQYPAELLLRVLEIASSTFYERKRRAAQPSARQLEDRQLLAEIVDIHASSGGTYGSPRVHAMLARRGIGVGRERVERLMRRAGLRGAFLRREWRIGSTTQDPWARPAPDLVERNFTADAPNKLWVADATRIPVGEGVWPPTTMIIEPKVLPRCHPMSTARRGCRHALARSGTGFGHRR
ncbi:IS3 family transposase [Nocardia sp. NBC_00403]|uniref:IS3 family transposase n=1 Tax=Nocardia sp. NBC_00403 TaxID=2975990 RepID=UPI002E23BF07